jgi:hypothetical protein
MTTPELPPSIPTIGDGDVESVRLTIRMDATLTVGADGANPTEWIKPGVEGSITFRGPSGPNEDQLRAASQYIQSDMIAPALEDVIVMVGERFKQLRRTGH